MDISSEMLHSLLPLFMVGTLDASAFTVGLIGGLDEATALIFKVFPAPCATTSAGARGWSCSATPWAS